MTALARSEDGDQEGPSFPKKSETADGSLAWPHTSDAPATRKKRYVSAPDSVPRAAVISLDLYGGSILHTNRFANMASTAGSMANGKPATAAKM